MFAPNTARSTSRTLWWYSVLDPIMLQAFRNSTTAPGSSSRRAELAATRRLLGNSFGSCVEKNAAS
jgi:hypothetical protein